MLLAGYTIDETIALPPKHDYGIGLIGCGGIVNYAHLPAYKAHGLNIIACYDINREVAERTAHEHGIATVAASLDELLADQRIQIVDIALPPWHQLATVRQVAASGKHMLCQKPLSNTYSEAVEIVQIAKDAGIKLAVNQQMRWDAGIRVAQQLIAQGAIGTPTDARIVVNIQTPWDMWPWLAAAPQLEIMYHSIHYLDSLRFLFGEPARVASFHTKYPGQKSIGETKTLTILEHENGLQVIVDVNHSNWSDDFYATFRFLGTTGIIKGTLGLLYNYPHGRPDTLELQIRDTEPAAWHAADLTRMWIPDAFIGPMAGLMTSIQDDSEPPTSGADNLKTLHLVASAYRSAAEHRSMTLE